MRLADATLGVALGEAANRVREIGGNNRGEDVEKYLEAAGIFVPAAWCLAFLFWSAQSASQLLDCENPLRHLTKRALVADLIDTSKARGWTIPPRKARPGDLVTFQWPTGNHVGIILNAPLILSGVPSTAPPVVSRFATVEGNTESEVGEDDEERQREGDGVFLKNRKHAEGITKYHRWDEFQMGPR